MYKDINEKVLLLKAGNQHTFQTLIRDGCDGLFMYGMAIEIDEARAIDLMKRTYIKVWKNRCKIDDGRIFDIWVKRMMIKESGLKEGGDTNRPTVVDKNFRSILADSEKDEIVRQVMDACGIIEDKVN